MRACALNLPHAPASATRARRVLVENLQTLGLPSDLVDDAELALSEMVGNAVRHARPRADGSLLAKWEVAEDSLRIAVVDGGGEAEPVVKHSCPEDRSGRGLAIIAALAQDWGVEHTGPDTRVWAKFALRAC